MTKRIAKKNDQHLAEAITAFSSARCAAALTGAGISVASGIPDFRSPGGLWTRFAPDEYATLDVFLDNPEKAWHLYRELGKKLEGKKPSKAHAVLADFEEQGHVKGIVTQNIDNLHQHAGSKFVFEIHGDHQHLHCIRCGYLEPVAEDHYRMKTIPTCVDCSTPLKPNVVLFGENVRNLQEINFFMQQCDLLMVIGTSAKVYPAASLPAIVKQNGGTIFEFNKEQALPSGLADYFFAGDLETTLPDFAERVSAR
ncbi:SIR2 family NAD-dependent protein deacylase [Desulfopila aestuarii]|uniref:protein acetyllysine N-acetyltransferase n=1 Tax=Desulfopila aestuarii DSM 18488 TaxID=1121416 RepID=A0A1M7YBD6_9BACT|nr:NAD-dependent protein deacylase [Desulfopila aestuarii]SHO49899.1 NAD-dependent deacetylase [Desulfopila aestuarii DSM 18488]